MKRIARIASIVLILVCCRSTHEETAPPDGGAGPRNIILFIGDGMGTTHFTVLHAIRGDESTLPRFTHAAYVTSHSANSYVTDSAAAATAIAAGVKANNAGLSMTPAGQKVETVLELAEKNGMATGLVTTTGFWDATPAAFASHAAKRSDTISIIPQMLSSGVDLVISNGSEELGIEGRPTVEQLAERHGFRAITTIEALRPSPGKVFVMFPGNQEDLDYPEAPLPVLTRYSIEQLSTEGNGFFLMIESEGTDTASHHNLTDEVLASLRSLDEAVAIALDFAKDDGETLVLFTADHETGAFQISPPVPATPPVEGKPELTWYSGHHTGQAVPLFAFGPGAGRFTGWIDNTEIGQTLKRMVKVSISAESGRSRRTRRESPPRDSAP